MTQKGIIGILIPALISIAAVGVVAFVVLSSSVPLKDKLFANLFPKPVSQAVSSPISPSPQPTATSSATPTPDTKPPQVSITSPTNGSTVKKNSTINITASASDNVAVAKVEFYVAGSLLCSDTTTPYNCSWNIPKQPKVTYLLTVKAFDTSGNSASSNISVTAK